MTPDGLIRPVHLAVPGRARLRVAGLRHSARLQDLLETGLTALAGVRSVAASPTTGNLVVHFDPQGSLDRIVGHIEALLRGEVPYPASPPSEPPWHALEVSAVAARLATSAEAGLTCEEAVARRDEAGPNELPAPAARSRLQMLADQFQSLPFGLLAGAAVVSVLTGGAAEAVAILAVLALNGCIGYAVESRSERTIHSLSHPGAGEASVVRDGKKIAVASASIVPGDLLALQYGTLVPADARIVSAEGLTLSEAMLTGESQPVSKNAAPLEQHAAPVGDRVSMVYRGTIVTGGSGRAIVVATGSDTQIGRIQRLVTRTTAPQTPMQRQLGVLGERLVWGALAVCSGVFGISVLRGFVLFQAFRSAVSLAVAAIPEGLPAVAVTTLALGIEDMRRRNVLVRRLDAVETLASVRVVCFDKTGTLTLNSMSVVAIAAGDGRKTLRLPMEREAAQPAADPTLEWLLRIGVLCSEARIEHSANGASRLDGSATETALVEAAIDLGVAADELRHAYRRLALRHRTEAYHFMVTTHAEPDGGRLVAVKGSPEDVLDRCSGWLDGGHARPLSAEARRSIEQANAAMAGDALRVLGFAFKHVAATGEEDTAADLVWVGLAGLADPVRPGIQALMDRLHQAGIHTLVMTGDQVATARAVARQLGLSDNGELGIIDTARVDRLAPEQLAASAMRAHVLARVSPAQKLRVIRALQQQGTVVAMVGDGINDSPALKAADIGIAMGRNGTDAAREVADVVLESDDLAVLADAIERGRATYLNVRRSIRYLLGTNLSEILVVLTAIAAGAREPLTVAQLLWINLISDVAPALGLALEPPAPGLMEQPSHAPDEPMVPGRVMRQIAMEGGVIAGGALLAGALGGLRHGFSPQARTMTFLSLVMAQLLHAETCRPEAQDARRPPNPALSGILLGSAALQVAALLLPGVRGILGVAPLGAVDVAVTLLGGVLPWWVNEGLKPGSTPGRGSIPAPPAIPANGMA